MITRGCRATPRRAARNALSETKPNAAAGLGDAPTIAVLAQSDVHRSHSRNTQGTDSASRTLIRKPNGYG
eukprot:9430107-Pyramimonas_sp.AAC.1